jgi:hypothetical protein
MKEGNFDGYTGRLLESEILPALSDSWRSEGYFSEQKSYQWVRDHQTWNPSDPENRLANDLHYLVAEKLGIEDFNQLKFYSAINSPLDYFYGVDGFFEIDGERFTLDITANPHKSTHKADYVVHEDISTDEGRQELSIVIATYLKKYLLRHHKLAA